MDKQIRITNIKKMLIKDLSENRLLKMGWSDTSVIVLKAIHFINTRKTKESFVSDIAFNSSNYEKNSKKADDVWEVIMSVCKDLNNEK